MTREKDKEEHTEECRHYYCKGECKDGKLTRLPRQIGSEQFQSEDR